MKGSNAVTHIGNPLPRVFSKGITSKELNLNKLNDSRSAKQIKTDINAKKA